MEKLRRPLFVIAYILLFLAVALEMGSPWFHTVSGAVSSASIDLAWKVDGGNRSKTEVAAEMQKMKSSNGDPPGYGIGYLSLSDAILLLVMTWMLLSLFIPQRIQGRIQGIVTIIIALLLGILSFVRFSVTLAIMGVMLGLFLAPPFGTAAYLAIWGSFDVDKAKAILSIAMLLKIGFVILLFLAQQTFLKVKSMLFLVATSLILTFVATFLIDFVPSPLASITDAIAGIIDAVAGLIWAVVLALMSLMSVLRAIRFDRSSASAQG